MVYLLALCLGFPLAFFQGLHVFEGGLQCIFQEIKYVCMYMCRYSISVYVCTVYVHVCMYVMYMYCVYV